MCAGGKGGGWGGGVASLPPLSLSLVAPVLEVGAVSCITGHRGVQLQLESSTVSTTKPDLFKLNMAFMFKVWVQGGNYLIL